MERRGEFEVQKLGETSTMKRSECITRVVPEEYEETFEKELCQKLSDTLSLSTLTHTLTPIPSLTDRSISISTNTNDLPRYCSYETGNGETEDINQNVRRTNWTTPSFATSTDDMISSGVFDSDTGGSFDETCESLPKESVSTKEDEAYKWHDISTSDLWDEDETTLISYNKRQPKTVESSSEDEPKKVRRMKPVNIRIREPSENSYPHSSNCTWTLKDFEDSSTILSDDEDLEYNESDSSGMMLSSSSSRTNSGPDDSPVAICSSISSDVSVTENIFDEPFDESDENIEHNMIATRYGLPIDIIHCRCHAEAQMKRDREVGFKLCSSGSCTDFEQEFGELDGRAIRLWHTSKRLNGFKKACRIYNTFISKPDQTKKKEFLKADYRLKINYPNYWIHLNKTYATDLTETERKQQHESKKQVTYCCQRVLKEQDFFSQHYQVKMRDFGENVKFSVDLGNLYKDFRLASSFLMKEYPSLFEHLMEKYGFEGFAVRRLILHENRLRFIEYSKLDRALLDQLENRYYHESLEKIKNRKKV